MSVVTFDTHAAVKRLQDAGVGERQAEAFVATVGDAVRENVATKEYATTAIAGIRAEIASEFKGLYRHLWVMAAGIVGITVVLVKLIP